MSDLFQTSFIIKYFTLNKVYSIIFRLICTYCSELYNLRCTFFYLVIFSNHRRNWGSLRYLEDGLPFVYHRLNHRVQRNFSYKWTYIDLSLHLNSSHILVAPPEEALNSSAWHLQLGQTNPLIFSTTPIIGIFVLIQKLSSFLTSAKATS